MPDLSVSIVPGETGAAFEPATIAAPQIAGVSWNNTTGIQHQIQIQLADAPFETEPILPGQGSRPLYVVEAAEGTTIPYACALHPDEVGSIFVSTIENLNPEEGA
jgi:plastocyanin